MSTLHPRVSIGLPVRNGENYLEECIESILGQTFEDFELIISDNASTDATPDICRRFAAQDDRIRYQRAKENAGAAANYTRVFESARGAYFRWVAHDDRLTPEYLERCVAALDQHPDAVLCMTAVQLIDDAGKPGDVRRFGEAMVDPRPHVRFRQALTLDFRWMHVWGLFRREIGQKTELLGAHLGHDHTFVTNLSLHGPFVQIDDPLFEFRQHEEQSIHSHSWRRPRQYLTWHDPSLAGKLTFPAWREGAEHAAGLRRTSLSTFERIRCYKELAAWGWRQWDRLRRDVAVPGMNGHPLLRWITWLDPEARTIRRLPEDANVILVDEGQLEIEIFGRRRIAPFLEHEGMHWGSPKDDAHAIRELQRMREEGAEYMVFAWPAFWWLDYYTGLRTLLETDFHHIVSTDRYVIFDLRHPGDG